MSRVTLIDPIESIKGKIHKRGESIFRCKQFRDEQGNVVAQGPQEAYVIAHPRDRKKNPPTGAEQQHLTLFGEVSLVPKPSWHKTHLVVLIGSNASAPNSPNRSISTRPTHFLHSASSTNNFILSFVPQSTTTSKYKINEYINIIFRCKNIKRDIIGILQEKYNVWKIII